MFKIILLNLLCCLPLITSAIEWHGPGELPENGSMIYFTSESHDCQQSQVGWVVNYYEPDANLLRDKIWFYVNRETAIDTYELGIPLIFTPSLWIP